jgi:hypothetical protein
MMTHMYDTDTSLSESYSSIHSEFFSSCFIGFSSFLFLHFLLLFPGWYVVHSGSRSLLPVVAIANNCMIKYSDSRPYNISRIYKQHNMCMQSLSAPELDQSELSRVNGGCCRFRTSRSFCSRQNEFRQVLAFSLIGDSISSG